MADEVIVLQNELSPEGLRCVHAMGNTALTALAEIEIPDWAQVKRYQDEIRLHHLEATWRPRGELIRFEQRFACGADCPLCQGSGCVWHRLVSLWCLEKGERIRQAIEAASMAYALATGRDPLFAWIRSLPKGVEYGEEVPLGGAIIVNLYSVEWMPEQAVAVGRGNH
jgi:hypothetical protein